LFLLLSGCREEQNSAIISPTPPPDIALNAINPTANIVVTDPVLPTSTPSNVSRTNSNGRIAYLFAGAPTENSLNGKAKIIDIEGNNLAEIELDCLFCNSLAWSPSGQWFAYSAYKDLPSNPEVYIAKTDNSQINRITTSLVSKIDVTWTPDEKYLTYVEDTETADIVNLNLDNGRLFRLTSTPGIESNPAWSPDGKTLAFLYRPSRTEPSELWIMQKDGSNRKRVADIPAAISQISWSPSGKQIAFTSP